MQFIIFLSKFAIIGASLRKRYMVFCGMTILVNNITFWAKKFVFKMFWMNWYYSNIMLNHYVKQKPIFIFTHCEKIESCIFKFISCSKLSAPNIFWVKYIKYCPNMYVTLDENQPHTCLFKSLDNNS